jgi:hypothetical protein
MSNPYAPQISAAIGGGLPGLPQRVATMGADPGGLPLSTALIREDTLYITPSWATYARVTAMGRGGQGRGGTSSLNPGSSGAHGGGGGGLASSLIEQIAAGTAVEISFTATATYANFLSYQLVGGNGGSASATAGGAAGVGSGGAVNYNGGVGATGVTSSAGMGGGGAAGRKAVTVEPVILAPQPAAPAVLALTL